MDQQSVAFSAQRVWGSVGGVVLGVAVALGAFGAHVVSQDILPTVHEETPVKRVAGFDMPGSYKAYLDYKTAVLYQMIHGIGIIIVGSLGRRGTSRLFGHAAAGSFLVGVFLFSGSLYLMATTGVRWLHMVVPLGGICFLAGWIFFVTAVAMPRGRT